MSGTLIDSAAYTTNSVPSLLQTDKVEGQGAGASHGGIGNSNAASQSLANRTAFLFGRQNTNIANIATLQGQMSQVLNVNLQPHSVQSISQNNFNAGTTIPNNSGQNNNLVTAALALPSQSTTGKFRVHARYTFHGSINQSNPAAGNLAASTLGFQLDETANGGADLFGGTSANLVCGFNGANFVCSDSDFSPILYSPGENVEMILFLVANFTGQITLINPQFARVILTAVPG